LCETRLTRSPYGTLEGPFFVSEEEVMSNFSKVSALFVLGIVLDANVAARAQMMMSPRPAANQGAFLTPAVNLPASYLGFNGLGAGTGLSPTNTALAGSTGIYGGLGVGSPGSLGGYSGGAGYGMGSYGSGIQGSYSYDPISGYLRGTAALTNAETKTDQTSQELSLAKEKIKQAKAETRRKSFDEWLHERGRRQSNEESRKSQDAEELRRSLNDPPSAEIHSGQALNAIISALNAPAASQQLAASAPIAIDQDTLRAINLRPAGTAIGNPGLLKYAAQLPWPQVLQADFSRVERKTIASLMPLAVDQAMGGGIESSKLTELAGAVVMLRQRLKGQVNDINANQYMQAARFLEQLGDAVRFLSRPDIRVWLQPAYAGQGMNAQKFVRYVHDRGLTIAPAVAGDEQAYVGLHHALVAVYGGLATAKSDRK
jgi:hypothetical protein